MRNKYYLTIIGATSTWTKEVIAKERITAYGAYQFVDTDSEGQNVVIASYPINRTIIESISHNIEE